MKTFKRTYHLSEEALKRLTAIRHETGLKYSAILDRMLLGLPVGERRSVARKP